MLIPYCPHTRANTHPQILAVLWFFKVLRLTTHHAKILHSESKGRSFKLLLCVTAHPPFLGLELQAPMGIYPGQYGTCKHENANCEGVAGREACRCTKFFFRLDVQCFLWPVYYVELWGGSFN